MKRRVVTRLGVVCTLCVLFAGVRAEACGGFFCQQVPIDQAGEQIIFRQDGNRVTAVVLIQYTGAAEDFSWVVPVPGIPEVDVGSDLVFAPLELATRPTFQLIRVGSECPIATSAFGGRAGGGNRNSNASAQADEGVNVLQRLSVGPFDVAIIEATDPQALVTWLADNDYDLSERGNELIATYVEEECNFVAVRLRKDQDVGDIQPLILRYESDAPIIPIRLTAVAAMPDMGVLVWLLGEARAVPLNYLHVDVNYTLLNWYAGTNNAYATYQGLVTLAMNEAGGQGFATDYAGRDLDVRGALPDPADYRNQAEFLRQLDPQSFYGTLYSNALFTQTRVLEVLRDRLPLPEGVDEFAYSDYGLLVELFDPATLDSARGLIVDDLIAIVVEPLERSVAVFDTSPYLTRLYTTLSADEMTLDPAFVFNRDLDDQPLERQATLTIRCASGQTRWDLELGPGTGREGEVVIQGFGSPPGFGPLPGIQQSAFARTARISSSGPPIFQTINEFEVITIGTPRRSSGGLFSLCGIGMASATLVSLIALALTSRSRRHRSERRNGSKTQAGRLTPLLIAACATAAAPASARACGGFFCQQVPIDQAGEQIIFRQDGNMVTAVVLIQYVGTAEDFSWVVPVPGIPEFAVGSDLVFGPLELATRPQFLLQYEGMGCPSPPPNAGGAENANASVNANEPGSDSGGGVDVLEELSVGPYDIAVVAADDPQALVTWLADNNYVLSERGNELIAQYVLEECNFVAVRLAQNQGVGDIQPLILRYESEAPIIPIRLTAVAAQPDMGVLVWLLGNTRAVPVNYLHVDVNYTLLNWYAGTLSAYASYQGLVTLAMNQAGGQGFATDYAGDDLDVLSALPDPVFFRVELERLRDLTTLDAFYQQLYFNTVFSQSRILEILRRRLPLPEGVDEFVYSVYGLLAQVFAVETLMTARDLILGDLLDGIIAPLEESQAVFEGMPYLTRLYTTLSADEMTLDPEFVFNPDLEGQALAREATLRVSCVAGQTQWTLTLGRGTQRDGEVVVQGYGEPPFFFNPIAITQQMAFSRTARVSASGPPDVQMAIDYDVLTVGTPPPGSSNANGSTPPNANTSPTVNANGPGSMNGDNSNAGPGGGPTVIPDRRSPTGSTLCGNGFFGLGLLLAPVAAWMAARRRR